MNGVRLSQVSVTVWPSEWLSFVRIWRAWVGGKQGASVFIHRLASQTRPLLSHACAQLLQSNQAADRQPTWCHGPPSLTRTQTALSDVFCEKLCGAGEDVKKMGPCRDCREILINTGGDNKTPQRAGGELEWEMENKRQAARVWKSAAVAVHKIPSSVWNSLPPPLPPPAPVCILTAHCRCWKY